MWKLLTGNPLLYAALALCAALAVFGGWNYVAKAHVESQLSAATAKNEILESQKKTLENSILALNAELETNKRTQATVEVVQAESKARDDKAKNIHKEISNATPTDDGPLAPVLRRALDRMRD